MHRRRWELRKFGGGYGYVLDIVSDGFVFAYGVVRYEGHV